MTLRFFLTFLAIQACMMIGFPPLDADGQLRPLAKVTASKELQNFSASSSIQFHRGKLVITGDDENEVILLDTDLNIIDRIPIYGDKGRQTKAMKLDFEASTILGSSQSELLVFGSGSTAMRNRAFSVSLDSVKDVRRIEGYIELLRLLQERVSQVNIEGVTVFDDHFLFVNRGNLNDPVNRLITVPVSELLENKVTNVQIREISLPLTNSSFAGVSEIISTDSGMLLFTFSQESTSNNYDDGVIERSYLGWIGSFQNGVDFSSEVRLDGVLDLSEIDPVFRKQKIEGVCQEPFRNGITIFYFVADNDVGTSHIFKVEFGH